MLAGNRCPSRAIPSRWRYAGHQFGHFVPQLGDGRAILLGEVIDRDGVRRDIQLKGSGPDARSRAAATDARRWGRCCANMSSAKRWRRSASRPRARWRRCRPAKRSCARRLLPGAVLTRVASSHIRVGTFQFFAARGDVEGVRMLADHVDRAALSATRARPKNPYRALLERVIARAGRARRAMAAGRLHPRRDEHRQHVRLPARPSITVLAPSWMPIDPDDGVQLDRRQAGAMPIANQPRHRAVESCAAGRSAAAALGRRTRTTRSKCAQGALETFRGAFEQAMCPA